MNAIDTAKMHLRTNLMAYSKEALIEIILNMSSAYLRSRDFGGPYVKDGTLPCEVPVRTDLEQIINATSQRVDIDLKDRKG